MKLLSKNISKYLNGSVTLVADSSEDIWHVYNLLRPSDLLTSKTFRKIKSISSTGSSASEKIQLELQIRVEKIYYQAPNTSSVPTESEEGATLLVSGQVTKSRSEHVSLGSYHTLEIGIKRKFTLEKEFEGDWDEIAMERLEEATSAKNVEGVEAEIGAIVCGEGVANVCLITPQTTLVLQRIEVPIPKKRQGATSSAAEKATAKFHSQIYSAVIRHFSLETLKAIIIASPGFTKDSVFEYLMSEASAQNNKALLSARSLFLLVPSPSHHVHSLNSIISSPSVSARISTHKFGKESKLLDRFFKTLQDDPLKAWYGPEQVKMAIERGAVGKLLVADTVFRSHNPTERKKWISLVSTVKSFGGEVTIFSSMHETGQQLNSLTGVAAILNFPLDIEVIEEEEREEKERKEKERRIQEGGEEVELERNMNRIELEDGDEEEGEEQEG